MGQPARLKENFVTNLKSSTEMAPGGSRPRYFPRRNPPLIDPVEDELTRDLGSVEDPHSGNTSLAPSCNSIPGPNLVPALISAPILAPPLVLISINELFKKFMKAYLESN